MGQEGEYGLRDRLELDLWPLGRGSSTQERLLGHQERLQGVWVAKVDGAISALPLPWRCQQELELQVWSSFPCCCEVSCAPGAALSLELRRVQGM